MDLLPLAFLLVIVLLGGVIAYVADNVGRKLGKKRLHVKRLRPRHVASIGTIGVGVLISFFTIVLMYAVSSPIREWIQQGRHAVVRLRETTTRLEQAQELEKDLQTHNAQLSNANSHLQRAVSSAQQTVARSEAHVSQLQSQALTLQRKIDAFTASIASLGRRLANASESLRVTRLTLDSTRMDLADKHRLLAEAEKNLASVKTSFSILSADTKALQTKDIELRNENANLDAENKQFKDQNKQLQEDKNRLTADVSHYKDVFVSLQAQVTYSETRLKLAQDQLGEAEQRLNTVSKILQVSFDYSRFEKPIFLYGEEVTRLEIPAGLAPVQAQAALATLLRDARAKAIDRGAKARSELPAAGIFEHTNPKGGTVSPDAIERAIIARLTSVKEEQVLVARAGINSFKGEAVPLEVGIYPNPIVYRGGQVLAETHIQGNRGEATILKGLTDLGAKVRERARHDRMLPRAGSDEEYGMVDQEQILEIMQKVRLSDRLVRLQAMVEDDTRAADPLKVILRIR